MTLEKRLPRRGAPAFRRELRIVLAVLALALASGAFGVTPNASAAPGPHLGAKASTVSCTSGNVSELATTSQKSYAPGHVVTMTASIHNTSTQPCSVAVGPTSPSLVVDNASGTVVWTNCGGAGEFHACALYLMLEILQPGASYTKTATWDQGSGPSGARVPAGSYELTATFADIAGQASTRFNLTALSPRRTIYVTLADSGRTYSVTPGTRLVVTLSSPTLYVWTEAVSSNPAVLRRTINSSLGTSATTFIAEMRGRARVTATGNPKCYPQCLMPSRLFMIVVSVVD